MHIRSAGETWRDSFVGSAVQIQKPDSQQIDSSKAGSSRNPCVDQLALLKMRHMACQEEGKDIWVLHERKQE